ncbi:GntR family transcriptional regulator [Achromobacter sp. NFACC18-2]|uniref:GntR family transcriptional regulator n=1 Tax=Achromobacter sp. NFACC18-2 TaxID=1564112 RepID=UPI0008D03E74|nr:GntR family transcriptional regulator [Achromobacter sp. NFACC18-2]SEJ79280.1 DNA-binding transcriptional regulator, GntR family [Achromobacter sp. NFACC18-2]
MSITKTKAPSSKAQALPHRIRDQLRYEILTGALPAGTPLKQDALATRFQASRIPVREALRQLETEGLVAYHLNRGAVVIRMDVDQICELLDIRIALEGYAVRAAVPNMGRADLDALEAILREYDEADSVPRWAELNRRFHLALCAPSNNTRLRRLIEEYGLNTDRYTHEMMSMATGKDGPQSDHYRILEACRKQDGALAARLVEEHINETKKNLVAMHRMRRDG